MSSNTIVGGLPQPLTSVRAQIDWDNHGKMVGALLGPDTVVNGGSFTLIVRARILDLLSLTSGSDHTLLEMWSSEYLLAKFNVEAKGFIKAQLENGKMQRQTCSLTCGPVKRLFDETVWLTLVQDVQNNKYCLYIGTEAKAEATIPAGWDLPKSITLFASPEKTLCGTIILTQIYPGALSQSDISKIIHEDDTSRGAQRDILSRMKELRAMEGK